jgi:hypothetical protein
LWGGRIKNIPPSAIPERYALFMTTLRFILLFLTVLFASLVKGQSDTEITDSTVFLFNDTSYKLTLHIFDPELSDGDQKNATLSFTHFSKTIFSDSLFCMHPWIQLKDFNNDKVKDVLVFNFSSARSNWSHYLYLVDNKKHKLLFVKGFRNLLDPELNKKTGIITSSGVFGDYVSYSFYKISPKGRLVKVGHSYEEKIK